MRRRREPRSRCARTHPRPRLAVGDHRQPLPLDELSKRLVEGRKHAHGARHGSRTIVEPRNPIEQYLAEVWSAALGLDKVGVEDNWFEMGGHSLLGIRILGQVQKKYGIQLSLDFFFGSPTIAVQAEKVQQKQAEGKPAESIGLAPVGRERFRMKREDLKP
ncbi:MAG: phosphopantetheine-binding protein [Bryobacterales bacterium]